MFLKNPTQHSVGEQFFKTIINYVVGGIANYIKITIATSMKMPCMDID